QWIGGQLDEIASAPQGGSINTPELR
ncbi:uncharacterized protein METZ01_LOCUS515586, partial [marine metagenome]